MESAPNLFAPAATPPVPPPAATPPVPGPLFAPAARGGDAGRRSAWRALHPKCAAEKPPAGISTRRMDSPSKCGKGSVFYERASPAERPSNLFEEEGQSRPKPEPCNDMGYAPKWGFHIHRQPSRRACSTDRSGSSTNGKFEANSALQALGMVQDIDSNIRRGAGDHSPSRMSRITSQDGWEIDSTAGFHSPRSVRTDAYRVQAGLGADIDIDNTIKRGSGACSPHKPGYLEELRTRASSRSNYRMLCSRSKVGDITVVTRLATGKQSPRLDASPRPAAIGSIANPIRAADGPKGMHNLMLAESRVNASPCRWGKEKEDAVEDVPASIHTMAKRSGLVIDMPAGRLPGGSPKGSPTPSPFTTPKSRRRDISSRKTLEPTETSRSSIPVGSVANAWALQQERVQARKANSARITDPVEAMMQCVEDAAQQVTRQASACSLPNGKVVRQASTPGRERMLKSRSSSTLGRGAGGRMLAGDILSELSKKVPGTLKSLHAVQRQMSIASLDVSTPVHSGEPGPEPTPTSTPQAYVQSRAILGTPQPETACPPAPRSTGTPQHFSVQAMAGIEPCSEPCPGLTPMGLTGLTPIPFTPPSYHRPTRRRKGSADSEPGAEPSPFCSGGDESFFGENRSRPSSADSADNTSQKKDTPEVPKKEPVLAEVANCTKKPVVIAEGGDKNEQAPCPAAADGKSGTDPSSVYSATGKVDLRPWAVLERVLFVQEQILEEELAKLGQGNPVKAAALMEAKMQVV